MLENIEAELVTADPAEKWRLRRRAALGASSALHGVDHLPRHDLERSLLRRSRSFGVGGLAGGGGSGAISPNFAKMPRST
jgi:hypothetical protein